jgi:ferredoxin
MRVWIDQDLCTGDGLCVDHCGEVFTLLEDGIAYVVVAGEPANDPGGPGSVVAVPERYESNVVQAAEDCPGECIFIEIPDEPAGELMVESHRT